MQQTPYPETHKAQMDAPATPANNGASNISDEVRLAIERRCYLRWPVFWPAAMIGDDRARDCLVLNFSPGGAKIKSTSSMSVGSLVALKFPYAIQLVGHVAWKCGHLMGIEFQEDAKLCAEIVETILSDRATAC